MMGGSWVGGLNASAEIVLDSPEDDGSMVDSIDLRPKELHGHLPCNTLQLV